MAGSEKGPGACPASLQIGIEGESPSSSKTEREQLVRLQSEAVHRSSVGR